MNITAATAPANAPPTPTRVETNKTSKTEEKSFSETLGNKIEDQSEDQDQAEEKTKPSDDISNAVAVVTPAVVPTDILVPAIQDDQTSQIDVLDEGNHALQIPEIPILTDVQTAAEPISDTTDVGSSEQGEILPESITVEGTQSPVVMLKNQDIGRFIPGISGESQQNQEQTVSITDANNVNQIQSEDVINQGSDLKKTTDLSEELTSKLQGLAPLAVTNLADSKTTEINTTLPIQQIAHTVKDMVNGSQHSLQIHLHPENLGNIQIRLVSTAQGVQVYMTAEKASTSQLLETNLNQLHEMLLESGVRLGGMSVGNQQQDTQNNLFGWQSNAFQNNSNFSTIEEINKGIGIRDAAIVSTSALDYRA